MDKQFSEETLYRFWDDSTGDRLEVSQDRDSLGLVEIKDIASNGKDNQKLIVTVEQARWMLSVIPKLISDLNRHP